MTDAEAKALADALNKYEPKDIQETLDALPDRGLRSSAPGAMPGEGGLSPIAIPKSRASHISSKVATLCIACSNPRMPSCRSLTA